MSPDADRLGTAKYVLLTTFRRDGTPVPTPVWVARDGAELVVWSALNTGKIKRIRNNGAVELAECNVRGTPRGPAVPGTARILDADASDHVRRLIRTKYGVVGWLSFLGSTIRRGKQGSVGIAISLAAS
jgi:uncharacterized protein